MAFFNLVDTISNPKEKAFQGLDETTKRMKPRADVLKEFKALKRVVAKVKELPAVERYLKTRPDSEI